MSKYIIDVGYAYVGYDVRSESGMLCLPVRINEFDDNWLNTNIPLTPYTEPDMEKVKEEAYQKGLNDAWEAARKIVCLISDGGFTTDVLDSIFGSQSYQSIMAKYSASDAIEKISKYKPVQTQIGDEVEADFGIGMVTKPLEGGAYIMWEDGSFGSHTANEFKLTGRHSSELVEILRKMKEK